MADYTNPRVRVYNDALTLQGTITNVVHMEYECGLDEIGQGQFIIPLVDTPARQYVKENNIAVFTVEIDTTETAIGQIVITEIDDQIRKEAGLLVVNGSGHLHKLTYDRMKFNVISDGAQGKSTTPRQDIVDLSQYTWTLDSTAYDGTPRATGAYVPAGNETLFQGLRQAMGQEQYTLCDRPIYPPAHTVTTAKDLDQLSATPGGSDDIHFKEDAAEATAKEIPIPEGGIEIIIERAQVATRVYVYGGGGGADRFTIADADGVWSPPSGFSADYTNSIIINDTLEAVSGQPDVADMKQFPEIKPEDESATAAQTAAVALCEKGLSYLLAREDTNHTFYKIKDTYVSKVAWPGKHYCRLTFDYTSPWNAAGSEVTTTIINVDIQTHILSVKYWFGAENVLMGTFLVGPAARKEPEGHNETAKRIDDLEKGIDHMSAFPSTAAPGGDPTYAPADSTFLVVSTDTDLTNERAIAAGAGLTSTDGGANNNFTLDVGDGDGLVVNADDVALGTPGTITSSSTNAVTASSHTHAIDGTIAPSSEPYVTIGNTAGLSAERALTAGSGLTLTDGGANSTATLNVGAGSGVTVNADDVALTTPGTLSQSSTNSSAGNHTHAITTTDDGDTNTLTILASDTNGRIRLDGLGIRATASNNGVRVADNGWIGLSNSAGRIVFDNQTTDQVEILDSELLINGSTPDSNVVGATPAIRGTVLDGRFGISSSGDDATFFAYSYGTGSQGGISLRSARGTRASPTATQSGDNIGRMGAGGHSGSAFNTDTAAFIQFVATQNWTGANQGARADIYVTPNNSTSSQRQVLIDENGARVTDQVEILDSGGESDLTATTSTNSNTNLNVDFPDISTAVGRIRIFRNTNTSGTREIVVFRGNGSSTRDHVLTANGGYILGGPTGGDKGVGSINLAGDIYKNNTAYTNPDYALELWATGEIKQHAGKPGARDYRRLSLAEVEDHIRKNFRLPGFTSSPAGTFERLDLALEKIEELYTHAIDQAKEIASLRARVAALEATK